ncbi:hypothetical protein Pfo_031362 [Paulownia fortunei]|nr:hypothetical protein Pfo_031362 [Paulownia fortunei]
MKFFDALIEALTDVVRAADLKEGDKIAAVSFSSAMHSLIAFDKNWKPLTRVITWADTRAVKYTEELKSNGLAIKWIFSIASGTGLFNIFNLDWDEQALEVTGVTKSQLPQTVEPYEYETNMVAEYAAVIGIPVDTPFVYGAGDGPLSNLGVNAVKPGSLGRCGPVNNGGDVFRWARDNMFDAEKSTAALLGEDAYDLMTEIASRIPAGSEGLIFHPYLGGERAPIWDANARGFRSLDSIIHTHVRTCYDQYWKQLVVLLVRHCGQMFADIFEQPVTVPEAFESGFISSSNCCSKALGKIDDLYEIEKYVGLLIHTTRSGKFRGLSRISTDFHQIVTSIADRI